MNTMSLLAGSALIGLFALPFGLQDTGARKAGSAETPSIGQAARLFCVDTLTDQANGACLQASSVATAGVLFPYPGEENAFVPRAFVGGGRQNTASAGGATVGGGLFNAATQFQSTVAGGNRNRATGLRATVAGGDNNQALNENAAVGGGRLNEAAGRHSVVAGGDQNEASGTSSAVVGGRANVASGAWATIGGGDSNLASGIDNVVGGGFYNRATGYYNATIAGGSDNTAGGVSATVGGGSSNRALRALSTVTGGHHNDATGYYATVAGGSFNSAFRDHSFAAGRRALANHVGAFVWADSREDVDKRSSVNDQFNVYASGGTRIFSNSTASAGVLLAPGAGSWTAVSDRAAKENVEPVSPREVLARVVELPIATWNYRAQSDSIRHMGPMAQDFYAAFELGLGETTIDTIDPDGVALAAIQGLHELVQEKDAEIAELRERLERLEEVVGAVGRGFSSETARRSP